MKKTPWFRVNVRPARDGIYETRFWFGHWGNPHFRAYYRGKWMGAFGLGCRRDEWRGLTSKDGK